MKATQKKKQKMMTKNTILHIDGNNLLYRAYYKFKGFSNKEGLSTGCIYGFFKVLHANIVRFNPDNVIVYFDTHRSQKRLEIYPEYKEKRVINLEMDFDSLNKQRRAIQRILRLMNIVYISDTKHWNDYEADDYIAYLVKLIKAKHLILSSDEDYIQCLLFGDVRVISPNKGELVSLKNCEKIYGYKPENAVDYKILIGDSSDNIKGYKGMGPKTTLKFLEQFKSINQYIKSKDKFGKLDKQEMSRIYKLNRYLIDLDFYIKENPLKKIPFHCKGTNEIHQVILNDLFSKYSLMSFMSKEFMSPFYKLKKFKYEKL